MGHGNMRRKKKQAGAELCQVLAKTEFSKAYLGLVNFANLVECIDFKVLRLEI